VELGVGQIKTPNSLYLQEIGVNLNITIKKLQLSIFKAYSKAYFKVRKK